MQSNKNAEITSFGGEALRMNDDGRLEVIQEEQYDAWDDEEFALGEPEPYVAIPENGCFVICPQCGELVESLYAGFTSQEEADRYALEQCPHCKKPKEAPPVRQSARRHNAIRFIAATAAVVMQSAIVTVMAATDPDRNIARLALSLFCSMVVWASCIGGWMVDDE